MLMNSSGFSRLMLIDLWLNFETNWNCPLMHRRLLPIGCRFFCCSLPLLSPPACACTAGWFILRDYSLHDKTCATSSSSLSSSFLSNAQMEKPCNKFPISHPKEEEIKQSYPNLSRLIWDRIHTSVLPIHSN